MKTIKETAEMLKISTEKVKKLFNDGFLSGRKIPHNKNSFSYEISMESIWEYVKNHNKQFDRMVIETTKNFFCTNCGKSLFRPSNHTTCALCTIKIGKIRQKLKRTQKIRIGGD